MTAPSEGPSPNGGRRADDVSTAVSIATLTEQVKGMRSDVTELRNDVRESRQDLRESYVRKETHDALVNSTNARFEAHDADIIDIRTSIAAQVAGRRWTIGQAVIVGTSIFGMVSGIVAAVIEAHVH